MTDLITKLTSKTYIGHLSGFLPMSREFELKTLDGSILWGYIAKVGTPSTEFILKCLMNKQLLKVTTEEKSSMLIITKMEGVSDVSNDPE